MLQVVQNYKTGVLKTEEVPVPSVSTRNLLVKTKASLVSAGTERTKIETAQMNIIEKVISRLDLVKLVFNNIKQEGLLFTMEKAFNKLDASVSLGYSCSGEIIDIGKDVKEYRIGDKVACVGEGFAAHSELNSSPAHFSVIIPDKVDYEEASFVGLGAIALNAVEISQLKENEAVAVIGLGLIGQIIIQLLKAKGCRVLGIEIDRDKLSLGSKLGLDARVNPLEDDINAIVNDFTSAQGVDAVIISAASSNNLPIDMAGRIARNKGRVILVGAMPIIIPRKDYYEKELYFVISRGFGSDLYYREESDRWYPYNYKPSSVKENMQKFLSLIAGKKVDVKSLISHRFNLDEAQKAYEIIKSNREKYLGIIFEYTNSSVNEKKITVAKDKNKGFVGIGFIGAGSFAQGYILPILKKKKQVKLIGVSTATGITAKNVAHKFDFSYCTTDYRQLLEDKNIGCVFITTRHNLHAYLVIEALKAGKNVFVEKPLCLNEKELNEIVSTYYSPVTTHHLPNLMAGFNRRFSPFIVQVKDFFKHRISPLMIQYRVNAGYLPLDHWVHTIEGGGRIVGEVCHFVDLLIYLTNSFPVSVFAAPLGHKNQSVPKEDNLIITIEFADGSVGTINYNAIGDISFPRERIEIFGSNSVAIIDNFRIAVLSRAGCERKLWRFARDMGHKDEIDAFVGSILSENKTLISFKDLFMTTLTTFKIKEALESGQKVEIKTNETQFSLTDFS